MVTVSHRSTTSSPATSDYLGSVLSTLWPEPARVTRGQRLAGGRPRGSREYVVLPNLRQPKLVLPQHPARATANALLNYNIFLTGRPRLKVVAMSAFARLGLTRLWPHRLRIELSPGAPFEIDTYLSGALGRDVLVCLYLGPTRAVQKPVLQLLTAAGHTFGFAKIGVNDLTRDLVRTEAHNLTLLTQAGLQRVITPAVLHTGRWLDHEVLVTQALTSAKSSRVPASVLAVAGRELSEVGGIETYPLRESPYWQRLSTHLADLPESALAGSLRSAARLVEAGVGTTTLDFGSWHGDWAPWNMTMSGDRVLVWDLEQFEHGVPLGFDAVHHAIQAAVVFDENAPADAFDKVRRTAPDLLTTYDVDPSASDLVVLLYLLEIATRYLHDGEVRAGGTTLGRLDRWLEPVLAELLRIILPEPAR